MFKEDFKTAALMDLLDVIDINVKEDTRYKHWFGINPAFLSFFWSGPRGPKAYSLWGGVVPSPSIGYDYL